MASRAENRIVAFQPDRADRAVPVLNALLGLRTALAPVFVVCLSGSASRGVCRSCQRCCSPYSCAGRPDSRCAPRHARGPLPAGLDSRACTSWTVPSCRQPRVNPSLMLTPLAERGDVTVADKGDSNTGRPSAPVREQDGGIQVAI